MSRRNPTSRQRRARGAAKNGKRAPVTSRQPPAGQLPVLAPAGGRPAVSDRKITILRLWVAVTSMVFTGGQFVVALVDTKPSSPPVVLGLPQQGQEIVINCLTDHGRKITDDLHPGGVPSSTTWARTNTGAWASAMYLLLPPRDLVPTC